MNVKIYTYSDPYHIDEETFWDEIKDCPQFCVSQTLVNGMGIIYPHYKNKTLLSRAEKIINSLYSDWESQKLKVRQMMEIDNAITSLDCEVHLEENIKKSLRYNSISLVNCIRLFVELGLKYEDFTDKNVNNDQRYLLKLFGIISKNSNSSFNFKRNINKDAVNAAIHNALSNKDGQCNVNVENVDTIVFHGIHQFSPSLICAIEDIAKFKKVILMFNYQKQYKSVYSTWLNIYSLFDGQINFSNTEEFSANSLFIDSYKSNLLADFVGRVCNGDYDNFNEELNDLKVIEFENNTEFANYCAKLFDAAQAKSKMMDNKKSPLSLMKEQLYSPSGKVNDILRAYFPEQFGERHFLDYPIGHFFVSAMNMWDEENCCVTVKDFSDIKECIGSGIIVEKNKGELLNTFNNTIAYFEHEKTLLEIIARLKNLKKHLKSSLLEKNRVGYFSTSEEELIRLIEALKELNTIICSFFEDFNSNGDNFRNFYNRIQKFIISKLNDLSELDKEMFEVIKKLLDKLNNSDLPEGGSYTSLKQTMSFYLSQDENLNKGANWIVRRFEQIDGDILRSTSQDPDELCYHFCCLSDKDICSGKDEKLPWPLDIHFFEYAHVPLDFKYQLFLKSKLEYKNFNRYALLYGLEFNRIGFKISYVKTENDKDNDLYFVLRLLGIKIEKYKDHETSSFDHPIKIDMPIEEKSINELDKIKASICPYKFALESYVQDKTIYRERFLIHHYMRVIIGNNVIVRMNGMPFIENLVHDEIMKEYQAISDSFKLSDKLEKTQLIAAVFKDVSFYKDKNSNRFRNLSSNELDKLKLKLDLLYINQDNIEKIEESELLDMIKNNIFRANKGVHCSYCSSRDICMEYKNQ